jgi:glucokinase
VIVDNQIRFQVLSEQRFGEKTGLKNIVVVEAGEGLVAGIISNGEIRRGSHSLAGEIGHIVVDPFGTDRCACGSCGCFEAKVCTKQLIRIARDSGMKTTETKTANDVFKAAVAGNEAARSALKQVAYWFAIGFQTLVLVYDPDSIVIQGAYAEAGDWFLDEIQRGIDGLSLKRITKRPDIYYSSLGKNRGVLGGAAAVLDSFLAEFKETHL